ncbi:MAG: RNA polymerase sigma factor [Lachnospiraceae bacterium]|nr:RNA polymerase sigma factor [Lachnospiraceae bacterium]
MDIEEIEKLVYEYGNEIYKFCCYLTSDSDLADELYQETFLKAVELRHKLDRSGNTKSYLLGVAVNLWRNYRRKKANRIKIVPEADYEVNANYIKSENGDVLDECVKKEMIDTIKMLVNSLSDKHKLVILLYYAENLQTEEIGRVLHIPQGTVMSRLDKARKILRKEMEGRGYEV